MSPVSASIYTDYWSNRPPRRLRTMNDLIDVQRNADASLTITIAPSLADIVATAILQSAQQLQVQYSQPENEAAPVTAPARLRLSGRKKISPTEVCESL